MESSWSTLTSSLFSLFFYFLFLYLINNLFAHWKNSKLFPKKFHSLSSDSVFNRCSSLILSFEVCGNFIFSAFFIRRQICFKKIVTQSRFFINYIVLCSILVFILLVKMQYYIIIIIIFLNNKYSSINIIIVWLRSIDKYEI